jgi:hypothetical protein
MATADPRLWADAGTAADTIVSGVASDNVKRAVLGQWIAEGAGWDRYPAPRNNPGNNSQDWARATGYPFVVEPNAPNGDNPIVTYPDQATGVAAYAKGFLVIRNSDGTLKYAKALAAARRGDGRGFVQAALAQGYGTGMETYDSVHGILVPQDPKIAPRIVDTGDRAWIQTFNRYPIAKGRLLYFEPVEYSIWKPYDGTPGNARVIGPAGAHYGSDKVPFLEVLIGINAGPGTPVYIKAPDMTKLVTAP